MNTRRPPEAPPQRSFLSRWLLLALALALLAAQMVWSVYQSLTRIEAEAESRLENHSLILANHVEQQLRAIDGMLKFLRTHGTQELGEALHVALFIDSFPDLMKAVPSVRTLLVLDANGVMRASNRPELIGRSFAEREYFQAQRQQPLPDRLHVSPPFTTVLGVFTIVLSRPILGPDGQFAGIVAVALDADNLRAILAAMNPPPGTRMSIVHDNGTLLMHVPELAASQPGINIDKPGTIFRSHRESGRAASMLEGNSAIHGTQTSVALRTVQPPALQMDAALFVAAARERSDILVPWREEIRHYVAFFILVALAATLGMWLYQQRQREYERRLAVQMEELRTTNQQLEAAHSQLLQSEKMASIGQLAAGVAHELNNPIGFVHSNLGSLETYLQDIFAVADFCAAAEREAAQCPQLREINALKQARDYEFVRADIINLLAESKEGLGRVAKIVRDLKDFSRPGEGVMQWADLHRGLDSTLNIVWNELKYKCEVVKEYGELPPVWCEPSQLNQVFMNLLTNAGHAIAAKGTITIRTGREGGAVWVAIGDTGSGIAPENLQKIFDPFFTTKPVGQGTGLGLSLSYGIVKKHGGRIEVSSEPGKGTTFTVRLPIEPPLQTVATAQ